jgi:gluconolactonase
MPQFQSSRRPISASGPRLAGSLFTLVLVIGTLACSQSPAAGPGPATDAAAGTGGAGSRTGGTTGGTSSGGSGGSGSDTGGAGGTTPASGGGGSNGGAVTDADPVTPGTPDASAETATPPAMGDAGANPVGAQLCPPGPFETPKAGPSEDICPDFKVKYDWNEGPTWVPSQKAFFFSNFVMRAPGPGDLIKYDPATNKCEVFIEGNGCNGLAADRDGNLLAVCQTPRALMKYDLTTKKGTVLVDMVEGKKLDSPNDIAVHTNGTIYFSNTTFELAGRPMGLGSALMRIDPAGMVTVIAKGGINPLGLSPDQKRLYAMGGYWDLDDQGVPTKKNTGFTLGADGIGIDCAGNVYTQGGAIVSPANQTIGRFSAGTNMAFGGEDGKTLLVVGGKNMHIIKMNLPGLPQ